MNLNMWMPVGLILVGSVTYNLILKSISHASRPFLLLAIVYGLSSAITFVLSLGFEKGDLDLPLRRIPMLVGLALGVIGIEVGFAFAYQAGWKLGELSSFIAPLTAMTLFFLGYLFFNQKISYSVGIGVIFGFVSLYFFDLK